VEVRSMADKAEIEVVVSPEGEVRLETRGLRGQACVEETKDLLPAVGARVLGREKTREFYQRSTVADRATTRRR
jgi:hypothetical protein